MHQVRALSNDTMFSIHPPAIEQPFVFVALSNAKVMDGQMLLSTYIPEWNKDICFYTDLDSIDSPNIRLHVMWKMSGDSSYVIQLKVKACIDAPHFSKLNLTDWRFI